MTEKRKPAENILHLSLVVIGYPQLLQAVIAGCFDVSDPFEIVIFS